MGHKPFSMQYENGQHPECDERYFGNDRIDNFKVGIFLFKAMQTEKK